jgi:hypothetical protein
LVEKIVGLDVEKTYAKLKTVLVESGCKIVSEQPPASVSVIQGSVWGISPKTAKKIVTFALSSEGSESKIAASSRLASDWRKLAVAGIVLSAIVALLCLWIGFDLQAFATRSELSFWSWIVTGSPVGLVLANLVAKLSFGLAVFLTIVIVLEVFVMFHASRKVDAFANESLRSIT